MVSYEEYFYRYPQGKFVNEARGEISDSVYRKILDRLKPQFSIAGRFFDGYMKYINEIQVKNSESLEDSPVYVEYTIICESGFIKASRDGRKLVCDQVVSKSGEGNRLTVTGTITQYSSDGSKKTAVLSDIILSDDRNVLSSWLVSYDLDFGESNLAELKGKLQKPLRVADPGGQLKTGVPASLFAIQEKGKLVHVP